jgi:hypothetical protein
MKEQPDAGTLKDLAKKTESFLQTIYEGGGKKAIAKATGTRQAYGSRTHCLPHRQRHGFY